MSNQLTYYVVYDPNDGGIIVTNNYSYVSEWIDPTNLKNVSRWEDQSVEYLPLYALNKGCTYMREYPNRPVIGTISEPTDDELIKLYKLHPEFFI
ncbi:MAG: hypothetical protein ACYDD5_00950 [Sulfuricurvum sp.]